MDARKTFALKVNIACCKRCVEKVDEVLGKIDGVLKYDKDVEERKVTISGTVDPDTIISKLKQEAGKIAELLPKERPQAVRNNQKMQIARRSKPIQGFQKQQHKDNVLTSSTSVKKNEHKHELELQNYAKRFDCNGCKEEGFGSRFRCKHCNYELHKECKSPKSTVSHDFFKGCTLKFFEKLPRKCTNSNCKEHESYCNACGKKIRGFVYHCQEKGWYLHPCCSSLKTEVCIDGVRFELRNKVSSSNCMRCDQSSSKRIPGWSYVCTSEGYQYEFPVYCVSEIVHEAWKDGVNIGNGNTDSNALEKISLRLVVHSKKKARKGNQLLKTLTKFLKATVGILLGDPTAILITFLFQLLIEN
uniref:Phorbol-ester/DAG-type domain-containing protein n=1 Tax=Davidia involucrata TaxID=16924 RepID=A0A5B7B1I1_DAVIN